MSIFPQENLESLYDQAPAVLRQANDLASKSAATGLNQTEFTEAVDLDETVRNLRLLVQEMLEKPLRSNQDRVMLNWILLVYQDALGYLGFAFRESSKGLDPHRYSRSQL